MSKKVISKQRYGPPAPLSNDVPAYPTFFRAMLTSSTVRAEMEAQFATAAELLRSRADIERIDAASLPEWVGWLGEIHGAGRFHLRRRFREQPTEAVIAALEPLLARAYPRNPTQEDEVRASLALEFLADRGEVGGQVVARHFDTLPEPLQVLAAVVLGVTGQRDQADRMVRLAERLRSRWREGHIVGPLWGLTDIGDPRAGEIISGLMARRRTLMESYGLLARVGDERALGPLIRSLYEARSGEEREDLLYCMAAICHRVGWERMEAHLLTFDPPLDASIMEKLRTALTRISPEAVRDYFQIFFLDGEEAGMASAPVEGSPASDEPSAPPPADGP